MGANVLKLILDIVPSFSADITRALRGLPKRRSRNYMRRNGGNVTENVLTSFHSREVLCTLSGRFVRPSSVCFVLVWLFIIWPFVRF